jgi:hypothetical protein
MLQTINEAYKTSALQKDWLSLMPDGVATGIFGKGVAPNKTPISGKMGYYWATRRNAEVLGLDHLIGSFNPGMEADFVVMNLQGNELFNYRTLVAAYNGRARGKSAHDIFWDKMFSVTMLDASQSVIEGTYFMGKLQLPSKIDTSDLEP